MLTIKLMLVNIIYLLCLMKHILELVDTHFWELLVNWNYHYLSFV